MNKYTTNIVIALAFIMGPLSGFADDEDDVLDCNLSMGSIGARSGGTSSSGAGRSRANRWRCIRQTNQSQNLAVQLNEL